jgi:hypothetical protein
MNVQINNIGLEEIRQTLIERTKPTIWDGYLTEAGLRDCGYTMEMLGAWASDLEDDINIQGINGGSVEIQAHMTKSGHVEDFTVTEAGMDILVE